MGTITQVVEATINTVEVTREGCMSSFMVTVRELVGKLDITEEQKNSIAGHILLSVEAFGDAVYCGGMAVGYAAHEYGVKVGDLLPSEMKPAKAKKPFLSVIQGRKE